MEGRPHAGDDPSGAVAARCDALDRCVAFLSAFAERRAKRVVRFEHGLALFDDELPRAWDLNVLWLASAVATSAEELAVEADRLQGGANLAHRKVIVPGLEGERLAAEFDALGWQCKSLLVMPQTRAGRPVDATGVLEVSADELETFWVEGMRQAPWADDEVVRQLVAAQLRRQRAAEVRYFAVLVDGLIASTCELFCHERIAQVESVMTVEQYRGRGYASAVISRASTEARAAGNELVFLLADASDWPQRLYRELARLRTGGQHLGVHAPADLIRPCESSIPAGSTSTPSHRSRPSLVRSRRAIERGLLGSVHAPQRASLPRPADRHPLRGIQLRRGGRARDDALDNAIAEAWVATFKSELVDGRRFPSYEHAEHETLAWIGFYNAERLHEELGDIPPAEYEHQHHEQDRPSGPVEAGQPALRWGRAGRPRRNRVSQITEPPRNPERFTSSRPVAGGWHSAGNPRWTGSSG